MTAMMRWGRLSILALPLLGLTACATMHVDSYADRGFNPQRYRSYAWGQNDASGTGDVRLDNNELFDARVKADIDRMLEAKGFVKATGEPDLTVHYHASVTQEIDVRQLDRDLGFCEDYDCRPYVYEAGTLFIDLVDTRTDRLVWRGWAEGSVEGLIDDQEFLDDRIAEAVALIAERLPRAM
jgi:hypothetical protein